MKLVLFVIFIFFITSCRDNNDKKNISIIKKVDSLNSATANTSLPVFDSTLTPFTDKSYKLSLHIFNTESYDNDRNNSILTFNYIHDNKTDRIFQDSFYCMNPIIDFQDFNNDKIKDVLIFYSTGARANPTYHLYLVDTINHKLDYVKGFEKLPNPSFDSINNIITSIILSGTNYYAFYRINSKNKLINLGYSYEGDLTETEKYEHAIKQILKKGK